VAIWKNWVCNPGVKPYPIPELPTTIAFPKARKSINFVK